MFAHPCPSISSTRLFAFGLTSRLRLSTFASCYGSTRLLVIDLLTLTLLPITLFNERGEARSLSTYHGMRVMCVVGGKKVGPELSKLQASPPTILVATPGRLNDHLTNNGVDKLCRELRVLVFDEADQLLEMGFRPDIERALQRLPPKDTRQTLLYSATFASNVQVSVCVSVSVCVCVCLGWQ